MANDYRYDFTGLVDKAKKKIPEDLPTTTSGVYLKGVEERTKEAEKRIQERGSMWSRIKEDITSPSIARKTMGGLSIAGSPFTTFEHTVSNPMLAMQRGEFRPKELAKEAWQGITGRRQGEYGDILKIAAGMGESDIAADILGLGLAIATPTKAINVALKPFKTISKWSDKGIKKSGAKLIQATDDATNFVGKRLKNAFSKVDDVEADPNQFIDTITDLPQPLINELETQFGKLSDFSKITIGKLREIKRIIGKYKPSSFGKGERGLQETIEGGKINKVYALLKQFISNTLESQIGKTATSKLMKIEETMTDAIRASSTIKKAVIDPTLRMATRGGKVATGLVKEGDLTTRTALNILRKGGKEAMKNIDEAIRLLNSYNRWQAIGKLGQYAGRAAIIGGAVRTAIPRQKSNESSESTPLTAQ